MTGDPFPGVRGTRPWLDRYVTPYYLAWMGVNATRLPDAREHLREVRDRALELSGDDVEMMLRTDWREQVMGAWFAIARADAACSGAVHRALDNCSGGYTAPVLTVAVLTYPNDTTVDVVRTYLARQIANCSGDSSVMSVALRRLEDPERDAQREAGDEELDGLLAIARELRGDRWPVLPPSPDPRSAPVS